MLNKKGEGRSTQMSLFYAGQAVLAVIVAVAFTNYAANGIVYTNEDIVARDLAHTINALASSPTPVTVNYEPDTANYVITITPTHVSVQGPDSTGQAQILQNNNVKIEPAEITFQPNILLSTNTERILTNVRGTDLSSYCSILQNTLEDPYELRVQTATFQDQAQRLTQSIEESPRYQNGESGATIILAEAENTTVTYPETGEEGLQRLACYTASLLKTNNEDIDTVGFSAQNESTTAIRVATNTENVAQSVEEALQLT